MNFGVYAIRDAFTGFLTPTFDLNDQSALIRKSIVEVFGYEFYSR